MISSFVRTAVQICEVKTMAISEKKMRIVINNYFKTECDVNTSIHQAFEKGFMIGVKKGLSAQPERKRGKWILSDIQNPEDVRNGNYVYICSNCSHSDIHAKTTVVPFCWHCGADMRGE